MNTSWVVEMRKLGLSLLDPQGVGGVEGRCLGVPSKPTLLTQPTSMSTQLSLSLSLGHNHWGAPMNHAFLVMPSLNLQILKIGAFKENVLSLIYTLWSLKVQGTL